MMKDIWIVENDKEVRRFYRKLVNGSSYFYSSQTFKSAEAILRYMNKSTEAPDIILTDIWLRKKTGIELAGILQERHSFQRVIILTDVDDPEIVFNAFKRGVVGYIIKNQDNIIDALKEVVLGRTPINGKIARILVEQFRVNPKSPLTKRESQILEMLSLGKSLKTVAEELFISVDTAKTHAKNISVKLQVKSKSEAIQLAKKEKYI